MLTNNIKCIAFIVSNIPRQQVVKIRYSQKHNEPLYINIHTHKQLSHNCKGIFNLSYQDIPNCKECSFGLHPWDIGKLPISDYIEKLATYCEENSIVAVGEIGIDRTIELPISKQIDVFKEQIILAERYGFPVIVHCVKAWSDLLQLRIELKAKTPWVFHGYNGNLLIAKQLISNGCYLSFGSQLLESDKVQTVFSGIALDKIFFETDNSNEKIEYLYKMGAKLHHICIDKLKAQVDSNYNYVLGLINRVYL